MSTAVGDTIKYLFASNDPEKNQSVQVSQLFPTVPNQRILVSHANPWILDIAFKARGQPTVLAQTGIKATNRRGGRAQLLHW